MGLGAFVIARRVSNSLQFSQIVCRVDGTTDLRQGRRWPDFTHISLSVLPWALATRRWVRTFFICHFRPVRSVVDSVPSAGSCQISTAITPFPLGKHSVFSRPSRRCC